ncbi:MAG: diguanylate cyclase [Fibrobacter sp.]|nr:diguanylate cyclase [Fibrobacter sp.]
MTFRCNGNTITLTARFGVTHFRKEDRQITDLIERADKALYEAKSKGRNRVELAACR